MALTTLLADSAVTRESLGGYILSEVVRCNGPQLPCYGAEQIIDQFWERYGPEGMLICQQAFGTHNGMWRGAPVTILRFQASQDSFFSVPLLEESRRQGTAAREDRLG